MRGFLERFDERKLDALILALKEGKISVTDLSYRAKVKPDVAASILEDLFRRGLLVRVSNDFFEPNYTSPVISCLTQLLEITFRS
jgi:ribosomal protein S25